jgi:hypothetical protein
MANIKFSAFTQKVALADVDFLVGYTGADNVRVAPSVLSSVYLPLAGGTMTGDLLVTTTGGYFQVDVSDNSVKFADNTTAKFGASNDLKIYHDGNHSRIDDTGTGKLILRGNTDVEIHKYTGEYMITATADGAVKLYYDDSKKFETSAGGVLVTGTLDATGTISVTGASSNIKVGTDTGKFMAGASNDLQIYHDSSNTHMVNFTGNLRVRQFADDSDITFESDDGSGGTATYFYLDGSSVTTVVSKEFKFEDNVKANFGTGVDLQIYHDASNSYIKQGGTGDLYIQQHTDDKDIIFQSDNGSGGVATYFYLDGSQATGSLFTKFPDNSIISLGDSSDCYIRHDGTDTRIDNSSGNLKFKNSQADGDIIFEADDGAGGVETYFYLDGGAGLNVSNKSFRIIDNKTLSIGSSDDLQIWHNGTDTWCDNYTGNLNFRIRQDDGDIIFWSDDGSGGHAEYFRVDGSAVETRFSKSTRHFDDVGAYFGDSADLQIYHDGSNSYIQDTGTGNLFIDGANNVQIRSATDSAVMASFSVGGPAYLYHGGSNKFNTTATGTLTTGQMDIAALNTAPASASAAGTLGEIRYTADYIYVCTATNTWKRSALSTW